MSLFSKIKAYFIIIMTQLININSNNRIEVIAHRGASSIMPENTMKSFQAAKDLRADFIELDVHLSNFKDPIVVHDLELAKLYNSEEAASGIPHKKPLDILKGEKIPKLLEVLTAFLDTSFMIEIKHGSAGDFELAFETLKVIEKSKHKKTKVASFSPSILQEVQKIDPNVSLIGILDDQNLNFLDDFLKLKVEIIAIHQTLAKLDLINLIHRLNAKVWAWTVNDEKSIKKLASYNVDGLITDDVSLVKTNLD